MAETNNTGNPSATPVIYLHAKGSDRASDEQVQNLLDLGLPVCNRLSHEQIVKTRFGYDQPRKLLSELAGRFPGRPVIFVRAGLQPTRQMIDELLSLAEAVDYPLALTVLSNADTTVNPFVGLAQPDSTTGLDLVELIGVLAPGKIHTLTQWTDHFMLLPAPLVERLASGSSDATLMQRLLATGGQLKLVDHLFLQDASRRVFEPLKLHPHESPQPPPFSELSARLQNWFNAGLTALPYNRVSNRTATLHITHSWGGGVASWLESFATADNRRIHFQLRSEEARAGDAYGQKLALYVRNELRCPIASWWLQPPIASVADDDAGYRKILSDICQRYRIGRIFVSSLIGHSIDALRSGLPTVQILHDHFPLWPLLSVNPEPFLNAEGGADLTRALRQQGNDLKFPDKDASAWRRTQAAYMRALTTHDVRIVAPGNWVLNLQNRLEPAFSTLEAKVIPHGLPDLEEVRPVLPRPRKDGRLRMVILGRMQAGKGLKLLSQALPELSKHVQVYLLGTGKSGEEFFGRPGVDVVLEYDRDKLADMLEAIGPDFAALLSVVPETFSYTLSELQQFRIPVIATRVGSFADRIEHGKTGWLVDTEAGSLLRQVISLCEAPGQLDSVRRKLSGHHPSTPRQMTDAYNRFCPLSAGNTLPFTPVEADSLKTQWAAAEYQRSMTENELRRALVEQELLAGEVESRSEWAMNTDRELRLERDRGREWARQNKLLSEEVETRTQWAQKTSEELKAEQQRRERWVGQLNAEIDKLNSELESRTEWARKTSEELSAEQQRRERWVTQLNGEIERLKQALKERTEWARKTDRQLEKERARGREWIKQNEQLSKEVKVRTEWAQKTDAELKSEQARREQWVAKLNTEIGQLNNELKTRTEWAQKTSKQLKAEQLRREKWVAQLNAEIDRLNKELAERTDWAKKTDLQLEKERDKVREWVKQNRRLNKEVKTRTEWAQKISHELKDEQQRRDTWVAQLNGEIGRLEKELEERTAWAKKSDAELQAEQRSREKWVAQLNAEIERLNDQLDSRTQWALASRQELEQEQERRAKWVAQLESEISRLQGMLEDRQAQIEKNELELENIQVELGKFLEVLEDRQSKLDARQEELEKTRLALRDSLSELDDTRAELATRQAELEKTRQDFGHVSTELAARQAKLEKTQADYVHASTELINRQALLVQTHKDCGYLKTLLAQRDTRIGQLEADYRHAAEVIDNLQGSFSWKLTRPLRGVRRVGAKFMQARAWNPLRWPWLLSHLVKNFVLLGFSGTLRRMQDTTVSGLPAAYNVAPPAPAGSPDAQEFFPFHEHPDVSIVIPVYNKWDYTSRCLDSLLEHRGKYTFEVIIVDDQSTDETADELAKIGGIRNVRNRKNLGFVGSCNRGAKFARGEYLVMLNNDTEATAGWLDELIDTFSTEPKAGLVGSRLVYPDGSLQESGGIIFNDGSGWNYGRNQVADHPDYLFLRESDYCSGASIALKTAFFHKAGGFDKRYAPAYYEDTDLAFKVRDYGLKVLIQPMSVVIHHEGVTSGTDTSTGIKKYQLVNQKKFLKRWRSRLEFQPDPINDPNNLTAIRHAALHRTRGKILFVDATTPEPDQDSGSVRLTNLLKIFRDLGYGVTFFADNRAYMGRYTQNLQRLGIEVLYNPWLDDLSEFFDARGHEFDYVFISRHYIAINYLSLLKRFCSNARFVFDTVDLHYLREQRLADLEKSKTLRLTARQTRRSELSVIKAADATLVVSSVEKEVLAEDAPGNLVHVLSNIHYVPGRDKEFKHRKDIYFVGGYQHPPNIDAACWFVNDIWPLIREQLPGVQFHLIGSKAPEEVSSLHGHGVVFHGFVESLDPFLSGCRLAVAPLRYGAGVKGKVNMSMAHGQPIVATPVAGEGMFAEHEREFLLAEDAESFAREVVRLYQDETLWYRLSDASIHNVETHFSVNAARASLASLFDILSED